MPSELDHLLHEVHAPAVEPPTLDEALEGELLADWSARYGAESGAASDPARARPGLLEWLLGPRSGPGFAVGRRLAVALGGLLLILAAACVLPTRYDIPLGISVEISPASGQELPAKAIAEFVRERSQAAEVDVLVRQVVEDGIQTHMMIRLWDQELALGELEHELREAFPDSLGAAAIVETPLEGEVETIWGRRLAHRAFHVALREAEVEQARAHLLNRLRADGFSDDEIVVEVRDRADGRREVQVEIERSLSGDSPDELRVPLEELGIDADWVLDPSGGASQD